MKLSVIFVNHNSKNGLRLALNTLYKSRISIPFEVIVVDNASTDRSLEMLSFEFSKVQIIASSRNNGTAVAYNKGMRVAKGDHLLLLSPYTLVNVDSLQKLADFMDQHPLIGGASVRMVDYKGDYLPESKHILRGGWMTFLKWAGFSSYFPKTFGVQKKSDWTEEFDTSEVDVLHEDCMLLRRSAIEKTGFFDERFRYSAYNIDLACRLRKEGFKTYYYSKTYLIQLPGKVMSKFSWDSIRHYYGAMFIFAAKYLFKLPVVDLKDIGETYRSSYEVAE